LKVSRKKVVGDNTGNLFSTGDAPVERFWVKELNGDESIPRISTAVSLCILRFLSFLFKELDEVVCKSHWIGVGDPQR
jgi:hypothetical protein